jgi:hypothetical protein
LRQASWASFNQAERQFQLGEWREGIALLARAIKFDPLFTLEQLAQQLVNGVLIGLVYSRLAIGLTLIWGVSTGSLSAR